MRFDKSPLFLCVPGVAAFVAIATLVTFSGVVSANPSAVPTRAQTRITGVINPARSQGILHWATMAPQTALPLLERATLIGPHAKSSSMELTIGLKLRNMDQLRAFLRAVQNPANADYHQFLTPEQFTARYGPSEKQVQAVVSFLERRGIHVKDVSSNRILIHTEAETGAYEHAFGIRINDYRLDGRNFFSTTDRPRLPTSIASVVANVIGLNNAVEMRPLHRLVPLTTIAGRATTAAPPPASTGYFNPAQITTAYDWPSITDPDNGAGATIAILTAASSGLAANNDYRTFWEAFGLPDHVLDVVPVDGDYGVVGGMIETILDVSWSGAMAPGAKLKVYVAATPAFSDFTDMYNRFVTDNAAQVMTTSWGAPEVFTPTIQIDHQIFMQAAAQGISMFAAAGDGGASDCRSGSCPPGDVNANYPSSDPYVAAANGTELEISDLAGNYASETAWDLTGGAISRVFSQPIWQVGPGVPQNGWRNNSGMAMNAAGNPYLLYLQGQWVGIGGTSAVAPQLAGLFAIAVSQNGGARLGQANSLIYNNVNAGNYASDFRDVVTGCNGVFCAGAEWDHPTGWGSPLASSLLSHLGVAAPAGTLAGTVTNGGGNPIVGAAISVDGRYERPTGDDGAYSFPLPVGSHTVTVAAFGYATVSGSVTVTDGNTTNRNFTLDAAPMATVAGKVSDGVGHGYGLYAEITATVIATPDGFGRPGYVQVAEAWTNPETGAYSLSLPQGYGYTLSATSALTGYDVGQFSIASLNSDASHNFSLATDGSCTAPGFAVDFGENFSGNIFPPRGWAVTNEVKDSTVVWNTNVFWNEGNFTGAAGISVTADSKKAGQKGYVGPFDTSVVTPPIPVSGLGASPVLSFWLNYQVYQADEALDVDISGDGGKTWTTLAHLDSSYGSLYKLPGYHYQLPLAIPAGATEIRLRWRYYDLVNGYDWYAQIDDISIGECHPIAGGLVMGIVTDGSSGNALLNARVADDLGDTGISFRNPADASLPAGYYILFAQAGDRSVTASFANHADAVAQLEVTNGGAQIQNFSLAAARFGATPNKFDLHVPVNAKVEKVLTITNSGTADGRFQLLSFDGPVPAAIAHQYEESALKLVKCAHPSLFSAAAVPGGAKLNTHGCGTDAFATAALPEEAGWTGIPNYPIPVWDNAVARDALTGKLYSVGGVDGSRGVPTPLGYAYDPATQTWSAIADMPYALDAPVAAFIDGRLYVADGWRPATGGSTAELAIYDPTTDSWSLGADNPAPEGGGAAAAVVSGKLYVIGGCPALSSCGDTVVQAYDPATNSWSAPGELAPYPHPVAWQSCGTIAGKIYCAGGASGVQTITEYADGYVYDPTTNKWAPIADIPVPASGAPFAHPGLWASAYAATARGLLVSGGVTNGWITNQGWIYSPNADTWSALPYASEAVYRGGSACGFYRVGGSRGFVTSSVELLPGHLACGTAAIPWLTLAPAATTVAVADAQSVRLSLDGTGQQPNTTSSAYLLLTGHTPYAPQTIPLTVAWDAPVLPVDLVVTGSASPEPVQINNKLTYTVQVENRQQDNHGDAHNVVLSYDLPQGASYVSGSGSEVSCALTQETVNCDLGTLVVGASSTLTIVVKATQTGSLTGSFIATADEPQGNDDQGDNALTIKSTVTSSTGGGGSGDGDGGGGGLGWLALAALLGLALGGASLGGRRGHLRFFRSGRRNSA